MRKNSCNLLKFALFITRLELWGTQWGLNSATIAGLSTLLTIIPHEKKLKTKNNRL